MPEVEDIIFYHTSNDISIFSSPESTSSPKSTPDPELIYLDKLT